jgi:hypothetical protein
LETQFDSSHGISGPASMLALTEVATSSALREEPIPHTNGIGTCEIRLVRNLLSEQSQSTANAFSALLKAARQIVPSQ